MADLQQPPYINYLHNRPSAGTDNNSVNPILQPKLVKDITSKPFEQIYMANIPNRHLDLSIIDTNNLRGAAKQSGNNNVIDITKRKTRQEAACAVHNCESPILESVFEQNDCYRPNRMNFSNHELFDQQNTNSKLPSTYKEFKTNQNFCASNKEIKLDCKKPYSKRSKAAVDNYRLNDVIDTSQRSYSHLNMDRDLIEEPKSMNSKTDNAVVRSINPAMVNDSIRNIRTEYSTDNENYKYKKDSTVQTDNSDMILTQHENCSKPNDQPTVKDLLKIIHQQNEQLLILQKQVAKLIENQNMPMQIEGQPKMKQIEPTCSGTTNIFGKEVINSTGHEILKSHDMKKGPLSKFAIDVMTSFEVSIRPPQNFNQRNKFHKEFLNHEPKIQEITTSDSEITKNSSGNLDSLEPKNSQSNSENFQKNDESLVFSGSVPVREDCVSPENSIHIDMQDYSSE